LNEKAAREGEKKGHKEKKARAQSAADRVKREVSAREAREGKKR